MSIKICFVAPGAYPHFKHSKLQYTGGAELQIYWLATELAKNSDFELCLIAGDYNQKPTEYIQNVKLIKYFSPQRPDSIQKKILQASRFLKILRHEKPNILISTANNSLAFLCSLYAKTTNCKHIHRIAHDKDTGTERIKDFGFTARLYIYGLKYSDHIIVQNKLQKELLLKNFNKPSTLFRSLFPITKQKNTDKKYTLWVSRYKKWKRPELFLRMAQEIPNQNFIMICPKARKESSPERNKLIQNASKINNLQFIDFVPFSEIQRYFNEASLFVNTSISEGFPNTFLQASQASTPIASLSVNPDHFISVYNCGVFAENNFNRLIHQVQALLDNPELLTLKGKNAYKYLKTKHDIKPIIKDLSELITTIHESG